jgi:hypothetical protein
MHSRNQQFPPTGAVRTDLASQTRPKTPKIPTKLQIYPYDRFVLHQQHLQYQNPKHPFTTLLVSCSNLSGLSPTLYPISNRNFPVVGIYQTITKLFAGKPQELRKSP